MLNKLNSFIKHIFQMTFSNVVTLMVGLLSAFIIPTILDKNDYGYYKIFFLYFSYCPLLQLGFVDGVLLNNAGKKYDELDPIKFRLYTKFYIGLEFALSLVFIFVCFALNFGYMYKVIFILLSIYCFVDNVMAYYQFISKSILDFTEFSRITLWQSVLNLVFIILSMIIYKFKLMTINFQYYVITTILVVVLLTICLIFRYKKITFGKSDKLSSNRLNLKKYFKSGFSLMFSYQVMNFMNNLDNQFISIWFKSSLYGTYAFAYSMVSIVIALFGSVSSVLFPYMNRDTKENIIKIHPKMISIINIIVFIMLIGYYPIINIVHILIPRYIDSLVFFKIVFPGVSINCIISSVIFNSYTYFHKFITFMKISFINILFSSLLYGVLYYYTRSAVVVAFLSILSLLVWFISLEIPFHLNYNIPILKNITYVFVMIIFFFLATSVDNYVISLMLYIFLYCVTTYIFYFTFICKVFRMLRNK